MTSIGKTKFRNFALPQFRILASLALLLLLAISFRFFVALRLATDEPDDGRVYAQIARNVLEQHVYSHESEPPYVPSLIRLPGYPLFLAAIYAVFGHGNNTAVRLSQAVVDTATCGLIALVAFQWAPDPERKHLSAAVAFALAVVCPFTAIYAATILTEVPTGFLAVAMVLAATLAFKARTRKRGLALWFISGVLAGLAVLFRPDSGLFAAAIGTTIFLTAFGERSNQSPSVFTRLSRAVLLAALFSMAFCLVLVPWTIRNRRVFHLFQPLAPAHGEMPGEFVPRGYLLWLRTWLDDSRYVGPVLWSLDTQPISIDAFPSTAFDSKQERDRVAALLDKYNHPPDQPDSSSTTSAETASPNPPDAQPGATEEPSPDEEDDDEEETTEDESQTGQNEVNVEMTPEIDAGFAQLGRERAARSPFRYYLLLPLKRAGTLWFDTHSQYYHFAGDLLPLKDLDRGTHQHVWLPLFAASTWIYSILGVMGSWLLWRSRDREARRWLLLAGLLIFLRLGFFATLENPEPRYTVEIFPFLTILAGVGVSRLHSIHRLHGAANAATK